MKTTLLFLFCLVPTCLTAQIVNIPDPNFKYALLHHGDVQWAVIDTNGDGEIQYSEAEAITDLHVSNAWTPSTAIDDLTGIEAFINLIELDCFDNNLVSLDLSQNTALETLSCGYNELSFLNLAQNLALKELDCSTNQLANLDITHNINLESLSAYYNLLTNIDITQNINLIELDVDNNNITDLNVSQNILLQFITVFDNNISELNLTQNNNLIGLVCENNQLSALDLSQNLELTFLRIHHNNLNFVDIRNGNNMNLSYFDATNNPDLTCIFVDDSNYCEDSPLWSKDPTATYVENQQECDDLAGIEDFSVQKIKIYPNPVKNVLHIETSIYPLQIAVYNIHGGKILQTSTKNKHQINFSPLKSGIYFIQLSNDKNQSITKKIIKL